MTLHAWLLAWQADLQEECRAAHREAEGWEEVQDAMPEDDHDDR